MNIQKIVREKLFFLEADLGFDFHYSNERGNHYIYTNEFGYIEVYERAQFDEYEIRVQDTTYFNRNGIHGIYFKRIDLKETYKKEFKQFNKQHRGIKWWFKSPIDDYWQMIADIIKKEIETSNSVFGLKITN